MHHCYETKQLQVALYVLTLLFMLLFSTELVP